MAATGRDIALFVGGVAAAGLAPIWLLPSLELGPMLATAGQVSAGLPVEHVSFVAFLAILGAAWVDMGGTHQPTIESDWE